MVAAHIREAVNNGHHTLSGSDFAMMTSSATVLIHMASICLCFVVTGRMRCSTATSGFHNPASRLVVILRGNDDWQFNVTTSPRIDRWVLIRVAVIQYLCYSFQAQRSGPLDNSNRIPWRGNSAMQDEGIHGEDLTGG